MTANADYGVSIVESFTPPKNWIPGQEINKDVYAVNTGNIDAFVKEDVSGLLNFTYEDLVTNFDAATCVELPGEKVTPIDGVTTEEAGGFLAWTNAEVNGERYPTGSLASKRQEDLEDGELAWTPPAAGDYIFRRAISVDPETGTTTYSYAGYHYEPAIGNDPEASDYVPAKYYKIVIGSDLYPTNTVNGQEFDISASNAQLGVDVDENGVLQGDPKISYVVLNEVENATPTFTFVDGGADRDYLRVLYTTEDGSQVVLNDLAANVTAAQTAYDQAVLAATTAGTTLAQKEADLRNAQGAYNSAKSRYDQTKADYDYANKLATETNKLVGKAVDTANAHSAFQTALDELNAAAQTLNGEADTEKTALGVIDTDLTSNLSPDVLIPANVRAYINQNGQDATYSNLTNAKANLDQFDALWTSIQNDITALNAAYDAIKANAAATGVADATDPDGTDKVKDQYAIIKQKVTDLKNHLDNYEAAYAHFADSLITPAETPAFPEDLLSGLANVASTANFATAKTNTGNLVTAVDTTLKADVDTYEQKYDALVEAETAMGAADAAWAQAVLDYNSAVAAAKTAYVAATTGSNPQTRPNNFGNLVDNGTTLVPGAFANPTAGAGYSAVDVVGASKSGTAGDPEIAEATPYTKYATVDADAPHTVTRLLTRGIATEANFEQLVANYSNAETVADPTVKQKLGDLEAKLTDAQGDVTDAQTAFSAAQAAKTAADQAVTTTNTTLTNAQTALNAGVNDAAAIDIRVYLAEDWEDYWTMDPDTDATKNVDFYLDKILLAGETSHKLIDSVEMAPDMGARDYKDLTFDLNVGLDSIQVAYDADQRGYTTETVDADANFAGMKAAVTAADANGNNVTWTDNAGVPAATPAPAGGGEGGAGGGSETPATTNVDVTVTGATAEHNLIKMVKTGTGDSATWAVADSGSTITDAASGYHYTVNGSGIYRSVTGLTVALNAVTGDTTPVVAYVVDD